jgi:hypothetical protein
MAAALEWRTRSPSFHPFAEGQHGCSRHPQGTFSASNAGRPGTPLIRATLPANKAFQVHRRAP